MVFYPEFRKMFYCPLITLSFKKIKTTNLHLSIKRNKPGFKQKLDYIKINKKEIYFEFEALRTAPVVRSIPRNLDVYLDLGSSKIRSTLR